MKINKPYSALLFLLFMSLGKYVFAVADEEWPRSGHSQESDKYSSIAQVNRENVKNLIPAWTYHSGESGSVLSIQTNPIFAEGRVFTTSACCVIALDALNGNELFKVPLPSPVGRRGLTFSRGNLFVPTSKGVFVIKVDTGKINEKMGKKGIFGNELSVLPPVVTDKHLIIANFNGSIEKWELDTGKRLFRTELIKDNVNPRLWSGLSYDKTSNYIYVVTSSSMNFFAKHYGDGYASSLVAIDGDGGKIQWKFQEIKREIWDLDMVGPPILTNIYKDGTKVPVAIALSKTGNTILVNRRTGQSIFGFENRRAPKSDIPGEITSDTQIHITTPEPFSELNFDLKKNITNLSKEKREYVEHKLRNARSGKYLPVSLNYDVVTYGLNGGAEWPGGAVDQRSQTLVVPSNNYPFILRAEYFDTEPEKTAKLASKNFAYMSKCSACHGKDLSGSIDWGMGDRFNPRITGVSIKRNKTYLTSLEMFKIDHKFAAHNNPKEAGLSLDKVDSEDLKNIYKLFRQIDAGINPKKMNVEDKGQFYYRGTYQYLLDQDGQFGSDPPWGYITALNLNSGKIKWKIPFGDVFDKKTGLTYQGDVNFGGVIVTAGDLIFATGTRDSKARAFDLNSGGLLWESVLPATGSAPPMTYLANGCQFIIFTATGGGRFKNYSDSTVAYRLNSCKSE